MELPISRVYLGGGFGATALREVTKGAPNKKRKRKGKEREKKEGKKGTKGKKKRKVDKKEKRKVNQHDHSSASRGSREQNFRGARGCQVESHIFQLCSRVPKLMTRWSPTGV